MTNEIYHSLKQLLDYCEPEEFKSWEENGYPQNHIFHNIRNLREYLDEIAKDFEGADHD